MLATLPDECKRKIWRHFEAQELCRVACVARDISNGANADAVWKQRTRALITREQTRAAALRTPVECGLTRQNARRDLLAAKSSSLAPANNLLARMSRLTSRDENGSAGGGHGARNSDDDVEVIAEDSTYWRHWYRDFHVSMRAFGLANAAFEAAKSEIQELKRERAELKELLQSAKSKNQSEKQARRVQMSCVRWMNRSHRRRNATNTLLSAQSAALSKAEITEELQTVESSIQVQSKMLFSLRSQHQKSLHRMRTQLARGSQVLRDLEDYALV
ncbi:hypothetical protein Gpo141_00014475 [Globisporangium polare]